MDGGDASSEPSHRTARGKRERQVRVIACFGKEKLIKVAQQSREARELSRRTDWVWEAVIDIALSFQ